VAVAIWIGRRCWCNDVTDCADATWPRRIHPARNRANRGAQRPDHTGIGRCRDRGRELRGLGRRMVAPGDSAATETAGGGLRHADVCHPKNSPRSSCT